jgi:hypothetical protein
MERYKLEEKLKLLREEYKVSSGVDKKLIEIRGKLLKLALEKKKHLY